MKMLEFGAKSSTLNELSVANKRTVLWLGWAGFRDESCVQNHHRSKKEKKEKKKKFLYELYHKPIYTKNEQFLIIIDIG